MCCTLKPPQEVEHLLTWPSSLVEDLLAQEVGVSHLADLDAHLGPHLGHDRHHDRHHGRHDAAFGGDDLPRPRTCAQRAVEVLTT